VKVVVEPFGSVRYLIVKAQKVEVNLTENSLRNLVATLLRKFPKLSGRFINPETLEPVKPYAFSVNGRYVAQNLNIRLNEGDTVLLFSIDAGG